MISITDTIARESEKLHNEKHRKARAASDPEQVKKSPKTFSAPELMALQLPEARQIVPGILYEGSNLIAAPPKMGKTYCALGLALAIASGGRALGQIEVEQGDVLGLFLEDGQRRLQQRLRTILNGSAPPERLTLATEWPRLDEGGLGAIKDWSMRAKNPSLVICDTLKRIRPREYGRSRLYDLDYDAVSPLTDLAHNVGIAFLINHHTRKMQSDDHVEMASGSLGLTGAVDAVLTLKRARGEADAILCVSGRDCADKELALRWDADLTQWNLMGDADEYNKSRARIEVRELLKRSDPLTPREVAELLGKQHSAAKKLLWTMAGDGELKTANGRYSLSASNNGNPGNPVTQPPITQSPGYSVTRVTDARTGVGEA